MADLKVGKEKDAADSVLLSKEALSQETSEEALFDSIIEAIGNDGFFQKRFNIIFNFIIVALLTMPCINLVLAMSVPDHNCHLPGREETNYTLQEWQRLHLPVDVDPKTGLESLSKCRMYANSSKTETIECQHGWDFDKQWFSSTGPTMENWVCDREMYVTNTFVASRIGELIGIFTFGQLGDRIGRKPVFFIATTFLVIGRTMIAFSSGIYQLFIAAVVFGSLANVSPFQTPIVIGMEISSEGQRSHIAFMQCTAWVLGNCLLPMIFWALGDWQTTIIATTLPCAISLFLYKLMPESPRWLSSQGRVEDARKVLTYIAKVNKTKVPDNTTHILEKIKAKKDKTYGIATLFFHRRLAKNTIMIIICWVICALSYYSLVLNISNMAGNPFMNFFWQSLVELPGYVMGRYLSNRIGRRWTHVGSYVFSTALCAAVLLSHGSAPWVTTLFVTCVKLCFTVAFYMVWLQAMEVYPTCIRQTGTSIGGLVANVFGILGPYVVYMGTSIDARLPYVVLLCLALLGCFSSLMIPETLHKKLPETLSDAQSFGADQKFWSFNRNSKSNADIKKTPI